MESSMTMNPAFDYEDYDIVNEILTTDEQEKVRGHMAKFNQKTMTAGQVNNIMQEYKRALIASRDPNIRISDKSLAIPSRVPITPGATSPFNNWLARSNLFSAVKSGGRKMLHDLKLNCPEGATLLYSGEELDIYDQDVYLTAMKIAAGSLPGMGVMISRNEFLRSMGLNTKRFSATDYDVLNNSFNRLSKGSLFISITSKKDPNLVIEGTTHLMGNLYMNPTKEYFFEIPQTSLILYTGDLFSYVDLAKRRELPRKSSLARRLQTYIASHGGEFHQVALGKLQSWLGYNAKPYMFKVRCDKALGELIAVGELKKASFEKRGDKLENGVFIWQRNYTD